MKTPNYDQSSKSVPRLLFLQSVADAFYDCGGWGFTNENEGLRRYKFTILFETRIHNLNKIEKIISDN